MQESRKRIIKGVILLGLVLGAVVQVSASSTPWRTYSITSGQTIISRDTNNQLLMQRTEAITNSNAVSRQVRFESRYQTMWSNPQVRLHRSTAAVANNPAGLQRWDSRWIAVANNDYERLDMPWAAGLTYTLQVRSAWSQIGRDFAEFRMSVHRFRNQ